MYRQFHEVAAGVRVHFNEESGVIDVERLVAPLPGFHADWTPAGSFATESEWYASEFAKLPMNEDHLSMIWWHWFDHNLNNVTE